MRLNSKQARGYDGENLLEDHSTSQEEVISSKEVNEIYAMAINVLI